MTTIKDMAEAHLLNVQREIKTLEQRKQEIDVEIARLSEYLNDGADVLAATSEPDASAVPDFTGTQAPLQNISETLMNGQGLQL